MKIKTSELSGVALDWAIAKATRNSSVKLAFPPIIDDRNQPCMVTESWGLWSPSTDWSQFGSLIESFGGRINLELRMSERSASFTQGALRIGCTASNVLIAGCRAIVLAKLGDEVDVPEELL